MTRTELAGLPDPKYLLYPTPWLYLTLLAIPALAFAGYLASFWPLLQAGQAGPWHWILGAGLGLLALAGLRPQPLVLDAFATTWLFPAILFGCGLPIIGVTQLLVRIMPACGA